jgi:hypothetical protein
MSEENRKEVTEVTAKSVGDPALLDEVIAQGDRHRKLFLLGVIDLREWAKGNNELRIRLGLAEKQLPERGKENEDVTPSLESPNSGWKN